MIRPKTVKFLVLIILFIISSVTFAGTIQLPQTGQTKCYDSAGAAIACAGTGQDGNIRAGVAWPSPRFVDNSNGTITDNLTGLMWTKDANLMITRDPLFDNDSTPNDGKVTWPHALDYVAKLNAEAYLGYTDWRLPNVNENESLTNADVPFTLWLSTQGFSNVMSRYWSSTSIYYGKGLTYVWVDYTWAYQPTSSFYAWPVRTGQSGTIQLPKTGQTGGGEGVTWPSPRFNDNGNGTVTDNLTGLMWTKDANAPGPSACSPGTNMTWQSTLDYVKCLNNNNYLDYGDWRLPNLKELRSLVDYSNNRYSLPPDHPFINVITTDYSYYWSSTTAAGNTSSAWTLFMPNAAIVSQPKTGSDYVWPVRAGQSEIPTAIILSSFTANVKGNKVVLKWETGTEINNIGFNIYRSETEDGGYVKINGNIIPAKGSSTHGAVYKFKDTTVDPGKTYFYKLEDIDSVTGSTQHGPRKAEIAGLKKKKR